ncbi:Dps family protein [Marinilabilia salmonicolor]|jgi:starvation-inducible DNA-binding protein|uniref:Starvation-inducible DNA-binding protein n=1 Tax=Marinilabilia salmonicolor TaxID=989 RepID=A0A2T0XEQ5_9BACT|nr:DNA starvation/stationary phase protection protein [Marinilabilia salmonicolor]PRY97428.1 starvation-inducible DNA-binding protein [Marinilabilia salmonicolor]RCW35343.1 starvation-inducible DNA-binding protein [Marinilabilia salmonicolor]
MKNVNEILGLKNTNEVNEKLNELLASFQVYYQNLRGFHWNVKGKMFFTLHNKFEELYDDAAEKVDEVAERILTLGGTPLHTFEDYLKTSKIAVVKDENDGMKLVEATLENLSTLIKIERELLEVAEKADDEGTNALASDFISEQEKTVWMLNSLLG